MLTLLSDFGTESPYVAAMKAVILGIAPDVRLVDLGHNVPAQDILQGALRLGGLVPLFPPGTIHIAVVDPGVGTDRKIVLLECREKDNTDQNNPRKPENSQYLICPDNGLVSFLTEKMPPTRGIYLENRKYWRDSPGNTFHGRDIMAPVAAHLANAVPFEEFGPKVANSSEKIVEKLIKIDFPRPKFEGSRISCSILFEDSFGNLITNVPAELFREFAPESEFFRLVIGADGSESGRICRFLTTYGNAAPGELLMLESSDGRVEIAQVNGNAARLLAVSSGDFISIQSDLS